MNRSNSRAAARTVTLALIAAVLACAASPPAVASEATLLRVSGESRVSAAPDEATLVVGVVTERRSSEAASRENATKLDAALKALRAAVGKEARIRTTGYTLAPQYDYNKGERTLRGYQASNAVEVVTGDLEKVGAAIDAAVGAGANEVRSLRFGLRDELPLRAQALREATQGALAKARAIAEALELQVDRVREVSESGVEVTPVRQQMRASFAQSEAAPTPVEVGTVDVSAKVTLEVEAVR